MAAVTVNLFANLREYVGGASSVEHDIEPSQTIEQLIADLGIPAEQTKIIFVDNRRADLEYSLQGGERIDLFSAIGGG